MFWDFLSKPATPLVANDYDHSQDLENAQMVKLINICIKTAPAAAKSLHSYPTLCDPIDGSPSGSAVPGILQARTLEWVAISFSIAWKWKLKVKSLSSVRLVATPWTAAYQAPPSMGFARQEYWSGLPLPSPKTAPTNILCHWIQQLRWNGQVPQRASYRNSSKNLWLIKTLRMLPKSDKVKVLVT